MFASQDGRGTNAEHEWEQRRHIYVVYVPPHGRHAGFAMLAMFGALAAGVR